jgi:hypothetical protein
MGRWYDKVAFSIEAVVTAVTAGAMEQWEQCNYFIP